ncbi:MAG: pur operon repressor [Eubacterium sp.]|nr:pur operon repressor [Eubacterium sp.]
MKKNERICAITKILTDHPNQVMTYNYFCQLFDASKTSVCEDVAIVKNTFEAMKTGRIETVPGAAGGVRYLPVLSETEERAILLEIAEMLKDPRRQIQGGFLYYSDILSSPYYAERLGKIIAGKYIGQGVQHVVTTETKGISVALESARVLNVPMTVIRRTNKVTEGATTSMNYVSGSSSKINTMYLSRRIDLEGKKVLVIDDFMKGGGTAKGMMNLMEEVGAEVVGPCVIFVADAPEEKLVTQYLPLLSMQMDTKNDSGEYVEISLYEK